MPDSGPGKLRPLKSLAIVSVVLYLVSGLLELLDHVTRMLVADRHDAVRAEFDTVASEFGPLQMAMLGTGLGAAVTYLMWKYRAAVNAGVIKPDAMTVSPAMAVGSYFIPVVNLVTPFRAMLGIARASGIQGGLVIGWWSAQIGTFLVSVLSVFLDDIDTALPLSWSEHAYIFMSLLSALISAHLVWLVTRRQEETRMNER